MSLISNISHLDFNLAGRPQFVQKNAELAQDHNDLCMATLYLISRCAQALALRIEIVPRN